MQDSGVPDWNTLKWIVGIAATFLTAAFSAVFRAVFRAIDVIDVRVDKAVIKAEDGDKLLWAAVNQDQDQAAEFRENIIEKVAQLPTKKDHELMERRLMAAIGKPQVASD